MTSISQKHRARFVWQPGELVNVGKAKPKERAKATEKHSKTDTTLSPNPFADLQE